MARWVTLLPAKIFIRTIALLLGVAVAISAAAGATPLATDKDMVAGVSVTEAACSAQSGSLWVKVERRGFCVRFWRSTVGGPRDEAMVAFGGDSGGRIGGRPQLLQWAKSTSDEDLQRTADSASRLFKGPSFWIARPGMFGSSGNHMKMRRTLLEVRIASAALDALKGQYGFKRFHLVGQSGGGHTVAGLAQLRSDIGCAAIASGTVSVRGMQRDLGRPIPMHLYYDPIDHVIALKKRPDLRLFVVSDRNDKFVSYRSQLEFVERVKAHNLPITHVTAVALDKDSHGLFWNGLRLAVNCVNGASASNDVSRFKGLDQLQARLGSQPPTGANIDLQQLAQSAATPSRGVAVLYDEDPGERKGKPFVGQVVWRTENVAGPDRATDVVIRADLDIPDRKLKATLTIRRNNDTAALPASHTFEMKFQLPSDFAGGGVASVPGVLMKSNEQTRGTPLAGVAVKGTDNVFLIGLSNVGADSFSNLRLLSERSWLDIPIVYSNQRRAIVALEKGAGGDRAFAYALAVWGNILPTLPAARASAPFVNAIQAGQSAADVVSARGIWGGERSVKPRANASP